MNDLVKRLRGKDATPLMLDAAAKIEQLQSDIKKAHRALARVATAHDDEMDDAMLNLKGLMK